MPAAQIQDSSIITSKNRKDSMFTKIALVVFAVVFLIILSEVAYLIFAKPENSFFGLNKPTALEESERLFTKSELIPTPSPVSENQGQTVNVNADEGRAFINHLANIESRLEPSDIATIYFETAGQVVTASFEEKQTGSVESVFKILIRKENGSSIGYYFSEDEVIIAQVKLLSNDEESDISLTDIQQGDKITLKSIFNLLDENPFSSVILEITR